MYPNIKFKIRNKLELDILDNCLTDFWENLIKLPNLNLLTKSILQEIIVKVSRKQLSCVSKHTISLKLHEAIIFQELWKRTTIDYTKYNTVVLLQWINCIDKQITDLRSRNVSETFKETLPETFVQR
jgi:hypothetical protein